MLSETFNINSNYVIFNISSFKPNIVFNTWSHSFVNLWTFRIPQKEPFFKNWSGNFIPKIFYTHDIYSQDIFVLIWEPQHQNHLHVHAFVLIWIRNDFPPWHILHWYAASHIIKISNAKYQYANQIIKISNACYDSIFGMLVTIISLSKQT